MIDTVPAFTLVVYNQSLSIDLAASLHTEATQRTPNTGQNTPQVVHNKHVTKYALRTLFALYLTRS